MRRHLLRAGMVVGEDWHEQQMNKSKRCSDCGYELEKDEEIEGGYVPCEYCFLKNENAALKARAEAAERDNERMNKMRTHCENCGADYMATGIEAGCPCKLREENERFKARAEAAEHELSRHASIEEKSHLQTIDERDAAEEALSQAYFLIKGESPQWSNLFGYEQALADIDDAQRCLRAEIKSNESRLAILDAQDVGLPPLVESTKEEWNAMVKMRPHAPRNTIIALLRVDQRTRQLLDALRAVKAWREIARRFRGTDPEGPEATCDPNCTVEDCPFKAYDALAGNNG